MSHPVNILHFGDQTADIGPSFLELIQLAKEVPALDELLQKCTHALQASGTALLSMSKRSRSTRALTDLVHALKDGHEEKPAIMTVLMCIYQLGCYLLYLQQQRQTPLQTSQTTVLGFCTGMLPAATATYIASIPELLRTAPEIVRIACRLGLHVSRRSQALDPTYGNWAISISGVSLELLQNSIQIFNDPYISTPSVQLFISATANSSYTVTGPPRLLQHFGKLIQTEFPDARNVPLPIFAAYHTSHIYSSDVQHIIGESPLLDKNRCVDSSLISTSTTHQMDKRATLRDALHNAVLDILCRPLNLSAILENLQACHVAETSLTILGVSNAIHTLQDALEPASVHILPEMAFRSSRKYGESFAIIGMAGRFPGGDNLDSFWETLEEGMDLHQQIPASRFDKETHYDTTGEVPNTTFTPFGCFLDHPDLFDARLFNMSPKEAAATDPSQRLLLMTTYEALQMAGYAHEKAASTQCVGTFIGQTSDDYREANEGQDIGVFWTPGGMRAFGPGRLNYYFGWDGPSYSIDAACSSSMAAIQIALTTLRNRECDMAIAGGVNIMTSSDPYAGLSRGGFLSLTGSCKTWDVNADGYCRGEGVGVLVIKRLEDAIACRDPIQSVIRGISTNHSAEAISITHPHAPTQERLFRTVLRDAGVDATEVDYVEMHGTGTQAGDSIETTAIAETMSARSSSNRPMYIGTVKPNIGHGESASGVASIIKSLLMFNNSVIPPHIGIKDTINPKIPTQKLDCLNIRIPTTKLPFRPGTRPRRILVNNFNAAGGNTSLLLEDHAPAQLESANEATDPRPCHIVAVSAKTMNSLHGNIKRLLELLKNNADANISDLAYSSTARQFHHPCRQAYIATDIPQLTASLERGLSDTSAPQKSCPSPVFLFSGQGSLYPGIGSQLYATCKAFRDSIREIDEICDSLGLPSVLTPFKTPTFDPTKARSLQGQLIIVAVEIALAALWKSWGVTPRLVCGHSLGEYAALCISGVLSLHDTLFLVGQRGKLIEQFCQSGTHAMLVVNLHPERLQQLLLMGSFSSCEVACFNGPESVVVSGSVEDIGALDTFLRNGHGTRTHRLDLPYAFHSTQLEPSLVPFNTLAKIVHFNKPLIPVASTCLGRIVSESGVFDAEYLSRQARQPVLFQKAIQSIVSQDDCGVHSIIWTDIGARPLCLPMVKSILGEGSLRTLTSMMPKKDDWLTLSESVANAYMGGINIDWSSFHREYDNSLRFVPLSPYAFDLKSYWLQYEGDWLITKSRNTKSLKVKTQQQRFTPTATLQKIEQEEFEGGGAKVSFVSHLSDKNFHDIISGHLVNNNALCPSSVYADIAFTAASYIWERTESGELPAMDVADVEVQKPLILAGEVEKSIVITASRAPQSVSVTLTISSRQYERAGFQEIIHARCVVHYGDGKKWMSQWAKQQYLIQGRIDILKKAAQEGYVHQLKRSMAYKLFAGFVQYSQQFQGMDEVQMDSELLEGSAQIRFQPTLVDCRSTYPPYWIDSLVHLSGFILNVSEAIPEDIVYISHGWESMRIGTSLSEKGKYRAYVRMQQSKTKDIMSGDVYILDEDCDCIVCVVENIKFRAIKKRVLGLLLPSPQAATTIASRQPVQQQFVRDSTSLDHKTSVDLNDGFFSRVITCICSETGVTADELTDDTDLDEIGLDSLMSLAIVDRLRREFQMVIPSSLFLSCRSLGGLRNYFQELGSADHKSQTFSESSTEHSFPLTGTTSDPTDEFLQLFSEIVSSESGMDINEVTSDTTFAQVGIDSLLGHSIIDAVYTKTGHRLPSSFFSLYSTFADVEKAYGTLSSPISSNLFSSDNDEAPSDLVPLASCQSVLLQGDPQSTAASLFLFPDGSGSVGSYAGLPDLNVNSESAANMSVWGLNSPFVLWTEPFEASFVSMAEMYVAEILRVDPEGPYLLGGWSIGGIFAFEAARILCQANKHVEALILIDSPCPGIIPPMSEDTIDLLDSLKLTGGHQLPRQRWYNIRAHFSGNVRALQKYTPQPMTDIWAPRCLVLWARSGVWETLSEDENTKALSRKSGNEAHRWIMDERVTHGPNGWDTLLPKVEVEVVPGDHFTIMQNPQVHKLVSVISSYIEQLPQRQ